MNCSNTKNHSCSSLDYQDSSGSHGFVVKSTVIYRMARCSAAEVRLPQGEQLLRAKSWKREEMDPSSAA